VPDAQLAALALEHGLTVCSADTDFARFAEVRWRTRWPEFLARRREEK
jgi:predicted nucleic acid-binding protein